MQSKDAYEFLTSETAGTENACPYCLIQFSSIVTFFITTLDFGLFC